MSVYTVCCVYAELHVDGVDSVDFLFASVQNRTVLLEVMILIFLDSRLSTAYYLRYTILSSQDMDLFKYMKKCIEHQRHWIPTFTCKFYREVA